MVKSQWMTSKSRINIIFYSYFGHEPTPAMWNDPQIPLQKVLLNL